MSINELLTCIGVENITSYTAGLITGLVSVILILLIVFVLSCICRDIMNRFIKNPK